MTIADQLSKRPDLEATFLRIPTTAPAVVELRPYQAEACNAILRGFQSGAKSQLLIAPTGSGKTVIFGYCARRTKERVLILVERDELAQQARERLKDDWGVPTQLEMGKHRAQVSRSIPWLDEQRRVVVASVQTLGRPSRMARYPRDHFALIVCDEAHHAAARGYRRIFQHFGTARLLGVTATPFRFDRVALGHVFERVAYEYLLEDAIAEGWLCPLRGFVVPAKIDLSGVRRRGGDFVDSDLAKVMEQHAAVIEVAHATVEHAGNRQTLAFAASRAHGKAVNVAINGKRPGRSIYIDGETEKTLRRQLMADFRAGRYQYLVNVGICAEGWDYPALGCVVLARPTQSRGLYAQMVGRGTRVAPGKADCLILDFTDNSGKHELACSVDIFAGREPPEVLARAKQIITEKETDVQRALFDAKAWWAQEQERLMHASAAAKVLSEAHEVNLMAKRKARDDHFRRRTMEQKPASDKQISFLLRHRGFGTYRGLTMAQADDLIEPIMRGFTKEKK